MEEKVTPKLELLKEWFKMCQARSIMHSRALLFYRAMNNLFMTTMIGLSSVSGVLTLSLVKDEPQLHILTGTMGILSGFLATIYNFYNLNANWERHFLARNEFDKLSREIRINMLLNDTHENVYASLGEFVKRIESKYNTLMDRTPDIPCFIVNQVEQTFDTPSLL